MTDYEKEVDDLRREVRQVRDEVRELIRTLGKQGNGNGNGNGANWREKVRTCVDQVRTHGTEAVNTARQHVNERPLTSVMTAFSAGMVLGRIIPRGSRE